MTDTAGSVTSATCPLCTTPLPGELVRTGKWAVIDAHDPLFPGFTRVIWLAHVAEMTDLNEHDQQTLMQIVFTVESVMRSTLAPDKINLASLGNQVPHLHWHVIPRWQADASFPGSVWSPGDDTDKARQRRATVQGALKDYHQALIQRLTS